MRIKSITNLPSDIEHLIRESEKEGFAFVRRLKSEWDNQSNRFEATGEFLLAAYSNQRMVGVCGVNTDPYLSDPRIARLRHLYVLPAYRSMKIGSELVGACLDKLTSKFTVIRLRAPDTETGRFYEKLGFAAVKDPTATHIYTCT